MTPRAALRRIVPYVIRWRLRLLRRRISDAAAGVRFAHERAETGCLPLIVCRYERPLICYEGQEAAFAGKRRNVELALAAVDGLRIAPSETFSMWRVVGRPTERAGYGRAAALKGGVVTEDVGGALCLASTLPYNVALLGGMEIVERRCHSVDSYGAARYFELGRDAAVEYAYIDLRFRNELGVAVVLRAGVSASAVWAELRTAAQVELLVELEVSDAQFAAGFVAARTGRRVIRAGVARYEDLGWSRHRAPWLA
jgi:vancomycin resistance protein VanW